MNEAHALGDLLAANMNPGPDPAAVSGPKAVRERARLAGGDGVIHHRPDSLQILGVAYSGELLGVRHTDARLGQHGAPLGGPLDQLTTRVVTPKSHARGF